MSAQAAHPKRQPGWLSWCWRGLRRLSDTPRQGLKEIPEGFGTTSVTPTAPPHAADTEPPSLQGSSCCICSFPRRTSTRAAFWDLAPCTARGAACCCGGTHLPPTPTRGAWVPGIPLGREQEGQPPRRSEEEGEDTFLLSGLPGRAKPPMAQLSLREIPSPLQSHSLKHARSEGQGGSERSLGEQGSADATQPFAAERSCLARATRTLWDCSVVSGRDGMQLETPAPGVPRAPASARVSWPCEGGGGCPNDPASPTGLWGPLWGAAMPGWGDGGEERRLHAIRPSHMPRGQKHQLSPTSWRGALLTYLSHIKGKVRGVWGENRNLHDSAHLTLIFSLSRPRIKPSYRVSLPGRAPVS